MPSVQATGILRTDQHGGLFAGTKGMKLDAILAPHSAYTHCAWWVVGSPHGNHAVSTVAAIRQRFPSSAVRVVALGRTPPTSSTVHSQLQGNELLLRMLVPDCDIIPVGDLLQAPLDTLCPPQLAIRQAAQAASDSTEGPGGLGANGVVCSFDQQHCALPVVWEGGAQPAGVRGAAVLASWALQGLQSMQQGENSAPTNDHIAMDSGTGCTAAAVAVQLALLGRQGRHTRPPSLHVVLVAGSVAGFKRMLGHAAGELAAHEDVHDLLRVHDCTAGAPTASSRPDAPAVDVFLHHPPSAKSFGAVNASVAKAAVRLSRSTGVLLDPVYTSKLLQTVVQLQQSSTHDELCAPQRWLVVHGGGAGGLLGHAAALSKAIETLDATFEG